MLSNYIYIIIFIIIFNTKYNSNEIKILIFNMFSAILQEAENNTFFARDIFVIN